MSWEQLAQEELEGYLKEKWEKLLQNKQNSSKDHWLSFFPRLLIWISYLRVYLLLIYSKKTISFPIEVIIYEHKALDFVVSKATHMWETVGELNLAARLSALQASCD